ncbi:lactadherin-like [Porites lutea]|uniref:lactadherin-like n=1 Tax=Porites lutea TaxID=51062 RepID=UPI003CC5E4E0
MDTNKIPDNRMTASSSYQMSEQPHYGRLNETRQNGAWCPKSTNSSVILVDKGIEYLQVDMGIVYYVCAVETQGRAAASEWVTGYTLHFSLDGIIWNSYYENNVEKVFSGNRDRTSIVKNVLKNYVKARFVRFYIHSYRGFPCLRVEILGSPISIIG